MSIDTNEARAICEAATEGPWKTHDQRGVSWNDEKACGYDARNQYDRMPYYCTGPRCVTSEQAARDSSFIAFARSALPAALAELRASREERAAIIDALNIDEDVRCGRDPVEAAKEICDQLRDYQDRDGQDFARQFDELTASKAEVERLRGLCRQACEQLDANTSIEWRREQRDRIAKKAGIQ